MDGGSTVFGVARHLVPKHPIVITNSLPISNLYSTYRQVEVHVTGGVVYPRLGVLTGPSAVEGFSKFTLMSLSWALVGWMYKME